MLRLVQLQLLLQFSCMVPQWALVWFYPSGPVSILNGLLLSYSRAFPDKHTLCVGHLNILFSRCSVATLKICIHKFIISHWKYNILAVRERSILLDKPFHLFLVETDGPSHLCLNGLLSWDISQVLQNCWKNKRHHIQSTSCYWGWWHRGSCSSGSWEGINWSAPESGAASW